MPLYNINMPESARAPQARQFRGSSWDRTLLALTGSKSDGSDNLWGEIANTALPVALGIVSAYYTGSYKLGSEVGNFANKGLDAGSRGILKGTDAQKMQMRETAQNEKTRSTISSIGGIASSIYSAANGPTNASNKAAKANNNPAEPFKAANSQARFDPSLLSPDSALGKFMAAGNSQSGFQTGLGGIINNYSNEPSGAGKQLDVPKLSSTVGMFGDDIRQLDDKKKKLNFGSSLPYDGYASADGFADGGKSLPFDLMIQPHRSMNTSFSSRFVDPGIKKKTLLSLA